MKQNVLQVHSALVLNTKRNICAQIVGCMAQTFAKIRALINHLKDDLNITAVTVQKIFNLINRQTAVLGDRFPTVPQGEVAVGTFQFRLCGD